MSARQALADANNHPSLSEQQRQSIQRNMQEVNKYTPKQPSRLREVSELGTSPQQTQSPVDTSMTGVSPLPGALATSHVPVTADAVNKQSSSHPTSTALTTTSMNETQSAENEPYDGANDPDAMKSYYSTYLEPQFITSTPDLDSQVIGLDSLFGSFPWGSAPETIFMCSAGIYKAAAAETESAYTERKRQAYEKYRQQQIAQQGAIE